MGGVIAGCDAADCHPNALDDENAFHQYRGVSQDCTRLQGLQASHIGTSGDCRLQTSNICHNIF